MLYNTTKISWISAAFVKLEIKFAIYLNKIKTVPFDKTWSNGSCGVIIIIPSMLLL